ncbi:MAG: DUF2313 domain-containing protein [Marivibrio sp.]|uniref:YmfQ family protein n=1 Tax=Marivibrio sp. TaxID=2039719 RepID=UPI0032EDA58F
MRDLAESYLRQLQALLPPGLAWPREEEAGLTRLLRAPADGLARVHGRAEALLRQADPRQATELLSDWERVLGLPDDCTPADATFEQRRRAAHAKLTGRGGQSRAFFIDQATRLGFPITIDEFTPFTCESESDKAIFDADWRFVWRVNAPDTVVFDFTCETPCDEPLRAWGDEILECEIRRRKPAHTLVIFAYGGE